MFSRDWTFSMPNAIRGVQGSCVVIPCSFDFKTSQPSYVNVKWYEFSETQYPLVYDQSTQKVIPKFRGKTSLYGSPYEGNCSLKIQPLELQHNQERLYPWMDPKPIETYHRENYLDVTVALEVTGGMSSLDWTYSMPSKIKGLQGSCLVIPCSFDFKTTWPSKVRVRWYELATAQYPLVYDEDSRGITSKIWGKTELYGSSSAGNCSLKINPLIMPQNEMKLFPWMDPNPIELFHKENYDNFVELQVTDQADKPELSILGVPRVGEQITVSCSVYHTCPSSPPALSMGKALQTDTTAHAPVQDGVWVITKQHTFSIKEDEQTVTCKATFPGAQTSEASINLNAQCIHKDVVIEPELADVIEGVAKNFTCKVFHSCKKQTPDITWNYEDMPETVKTKQNRGSGWVTDSNVLFLASMEDHGKKLTCTAKFPYGEITASVVLYVQKFVPKIVDPYENDTLHIYEANVVSRISALTRSCVVIPCTFQIGDVPVTQLRGLWYTKNGEYVFHTGQTNILDNFKEKGSDKYRFNHSCVFIVMKATPDKPVISDLPEELEPGKRYTISCSVTHTCPSHPPTITWSIPTAKKVVSHMETSGGQWKTISTVTYVPTGYEKEEELICTASFWRGKKQERSVELPVKRYEGLRMETIGPYILAPLFLVLLLCGVAIAGAVIYKKRARRTHSDGERTEKRRSVWAQLTRRSDGTASWLPSVKRNNAPARPPKPEKRQSIWNRFSSNNINIILSSQKRSSRQSWSDGGVQCTPKATETWEKAQHLESLFQESSRSYSGVQCCVWNCRILQTIFPITIECPKILQQIRRRLFGSL
ncbi:hypothetical protein AOLI_G00296420 [Acnodon oligacanthus]